jgi:[protein-PII] uridylyltransferase
MTNYLRRARSALHEFLRGRRGAPPDDTLPGPPRRSPHAAPVPAGDNLVVADGRVMFVDQTQAAANPLSWLDAFQAAVAQNVPLSASALAIVGEHAARVPAEALLSAERAPAGLLELLRPRAGLSSRLREMHQVGLLGALFPEAGLSSRRRLDAVSGDDAADPHALLTIQGLERLLGEGSQTGERFGSMLRELNAPELLVLALLLHDGGQSKDGHDTEEAVRLAQTALDRLRLDGDARRMVEFLIRHQLQMSLIAFRQDTGDPVVIANFGSLFSTEEHLKMLCLVTVADLGAMGPDTLTPWRAELLWRLFVDTYNQMTMTYGDEVIDSHEAALTALRANRPHDIPEAEMASFLEGLPRRYLTLFQPESIYDHVRLWRGMGPDDVHFFLNKKSDVWELTVVTLDKPYLFSNICGVLSFCDLDILRGHALTSRSALVLDVFQFTDHKGCLVRPQLDPLLSEVVGGATDIRALLEEKARSVTAGRTGRTAPVIYFDNETSQRYTILELVADDAPGLLHRISRIISKHGCVVDLVLISTEARKAIDVFHMRKEGTKLTDSDELTLTEDFERMLDGEPREGSGADG